MTTPSSAQTGTVPRGTIEEMNAKIAEMKVAMAAQMKELENQKAIVEAQMKALESETKRLKEEAVTAAEAERMSKFAALVANGKVVLKENKTEIILDLMMKGYSKDAIIAYTGYTIKECTDITWRVYESYGCNADR